MNDENQSEILMEKQKKTYVLPIAMMFALFFMISFVTGLQNPMGIIVRNQFGASNFMSQLGNAANFIAYAFMGLPAGLMLQRIGYKKTALAAVAVGFIGVGISYLSGLQASFGVYLIGAFVSGFSMCMLNTVVNPMLNTLGGGGNRGNQLLQFGGSMNSLGATIVPVFVGYLMGNSAQATISDAAPALFIAMGIFALAFIVLLVMNIPEPYALTNEKTAERNEHSALSFRHFILGTVAIFVYVGVEVGIPNFANLFMTTDLGIDTTVAGSVVGTYWFLMLVGRIAGSSLGARISAKTMLSTVATLAGLLGHRRHALPREQRGEHARLQERHLVRHGAGSRQHHAAGALRSVHLGDVGRHLQSGRRGAGQIHLGRFGHLHGDGVRRRHPASDPGTGGRPCGLHDVLLGGNGRSALPPLLCTRRSPERQHRHRGELISPPTDCTAGPSQGRPVRFPTTEPSSGTPPALKAARPSRRTWPPH